MATQEEFQRRDAEPSGWAVGGMVFAATMMCLIGVFQAIVGLAAIINDEFFVVTRNYAFDLDVSGWGWIHLLLGICVAGSGFLLFAGSRLAAAFAVLLASLSAIANFFFIPYYPFWSILMIAIAVWVIWSVTRPGVTER
jgi:hypothetical protein